jgi:hypothetical protein
VIASSFKASKAVHLRWNCVTASMVGVSMHMMLSPVGAYCDKRIREAPMNWHEIHEIASHGRLEGKSKCQQKTKKTKDQEAHPPSVNKWMLISSGEVAGAELGYHATRWSKRWAWDHPCFCSFTGQTGDSLKSLVHSTKPNLAAPCSKKVWH